MLLLLTRYRTCYFRITSFLKYCTLSVLTLLLVIFFVDLRQDMLTLQLFKIMDRIWQNEGLDLGFVISELQKYTGRKLATECSVLKAKEVNDITSPITHCEHPTRIQTLVSSFEIATSANL